MSILLFLGIGCLAQHIGVRSVAVKGALKCGNNAAAEGVKVVLFRIDSKGFFGLDICIIAL